MAGTASEVDLPLHAGIGLLAECRRGFFAKLTTRRLQCGVFCSVVELQAAINRFLAEASTAPRPFRWTKDPHKILAAVKRGIKC
jgi:hypothetical protein